MEGAGAGKENYLVLKSIIQSMVMQSFCLAPIVAVSQVFLATRQGKSLSTEAKPKTQDKIQKNRALINAQNLSIFE